jgi:hypothetical protein
MPLPIRHYYHVYAAGTWQQPVAEHLATLAGATLNAETVIGLVGPEDQRQEARQLISRRLKPARWVEADNGWEQTTLAQIHADVHHVPDEFAVLYAHTKGAHDNTQLNAAWRRSMTARLVGEWEGCVELLAGGHDTVGCHWVSAGDGVSFYGGNFWWATASYLRRLPPPDTENRWRAETWVSSASGPKAFDLLPGWPRYE